MRFWKRQAVCSFAQLMCDQKELSKVYLFIFPPEVGRQGSPGALTARSIAFASSMMESNSNTNSERRLLDAFISSTRRSISRKRRFFSRLERREASLFLSRRSSLSISKSLSDAFRILVPWPLSCALALVSAFSFCRWFVGGFGDAYWH